MLSMKIQALHFTQWSNGSELSRLMDGGHSCVEGGLVFDSILPECASRKFAPHWNDDGCSSCQWSQKPYQESSRSDLETA